MSIIDTGTVPMPETVNGIRPVNGTTALEQISPAPYAEVDWGLTASSFDETRGAREADPLPPDEKPVELAASFRERATHILNAYGAKISDDVSEIESEGGRRPSAHVLRRSSALAARIAPRVAFAQRLAWGSFVQEDGSIAIVLQSLVTDRRVTFVVSGLRDRVQVNQVDEGMRHSTSLVTLQDDEQIRRLTAWVTKRS